MNCINPRMVFPSNDWDSVKDPVQVPCGKCIPCLVNRRTDWCFRLREEHKVSKSSHFVTLTYDQKHLPSDQSLDKKHLQDYLKRLRKKDGTNRIRYFAVGEYGSKSLRPHYHILLFNARAEDARVVWRDSRGNPIGIVHIGHVTDASIAYCTKYMIQPEVMIQGLQKPFSVMSRRYGIGAFYLSDENIQWHRDDDRNYLLFDGGMKGRLPRFYREKIWPRVRLEDGALPSICECFNGMRERVSEKAKLLVLENDQKKYAVWKKRYGERWKEAFDYARDQALLNVKVKVAYSQKF